MNAIYALSHLVSYTFYDRSRSRLSADVHHDWLLVILNSHLLFIGREIEEVLLEGNGKGVLLLSEYLEDLAVLIQKYKFLVREYEGDSERVSMEVMARLQEFWDSMCFLSDDLKLLDGLEG